MPAKANPNIEHFIKHQKIYLTVLLIIILLFPLTTRYLSHNFTVIGEPSYFYLQQAEQTAPFNFYQNPYSLLLSLNLAHHQLIYQSIPFILALLSFFLLFHLLQKFDLSPQNRFFFLLFLLLSPAFIYTFTVLGHQSFFIFLNLLAFNLLLQKRTFLRYLSFPFFALIPFFDIFSSVLTLLFISICFHFKKDPFIKILASPLILLTFFNLFLHKPFLLGPYLPQNYLIDFFADLGGPFGLRLFILLLALFGLGFTWKKKKIYLTYPFILLSFLLFFYQTPTLIYLTPVITFFAAVGFTHLLNREWKISIIKNAALFLLILGLLFSTLTNLNNISHLSPTPETRESLLWLRENAPSYKTIFSSPQDSYLVEYFSQRPAFLHYHDSDFKTKNNLASRIFSSSYIKETFPLLEQNNISHIYLSSQTLADLPTDRGLIFLFQNERFKRLYSQDNIEVWKFT